MNEFKNKFKKTNTHESTFAKMNAGLWCTFTSHFSTSSSALKRPTTFVTHRYSRISPRRVNILKKAQTFGWQDQTRLSKLQQNVDLNPVQSKSILPEYINDLNILFFLVQRCFITFKMNFLWFFIMSLKKWLYVKINQ